MGLLADKGKFKVIGGALLSSLKEIENAVDVTSVKTKFCLPTDQHTIEDNKF
jgi:phenylalanine-4-hydroxylase